MLDCHTFVLGALDETAEEVQETLDFVDRLDPDVAVFIVFMEDRETMTVHRARHRDAILRLLADEAPKRARVGRARARHSLRREDHRASCGAAACKGPSWLHLARMRAGAA